MTNQKRILIVEDECTVADSIKLLLEESGYQVTGIAKNKNEFQSKIKVETPDLILLDIHLADGDDGIDSLKSLEEYGDIPVLLLTGDSSPDIVAKASSINPSGYLVKPYRDDELLVNVQVALTRTSENREETKSALATFLKKSEDSLDGLLKEFAIYLKTKRKELGLTQVMVADDLGVNYRHYQNIEAGKINIRMETFMKLINFFQEKEKEKERTKII